MDTILTVVPTAVTGVGGTVIVARAGQALFKQLGRLLVSLGKALRKSELSKRIVSKLSNKPERFEIRRPQAQKLSEPKRVEGDANDGTMGEESVAPNKVESSVPTYETPFNPLTKAQRIDLKAKLESRTITKDEYQRLEWDRRFANRRATGVRKFWAEERARLRAGESGTRKWTAEQRDAILAGKRPQYNGETIQGHHKYNALDHPQIANDPQNIFPATIKRSTSSDGMVEIGEMTHLVNR